MNISNKHHFSLTLAQEIEKVLKESRRLAVKHADSVVLVKNTEHLIGEYVILFEDIEPSSFHFSVTDPHQEGDLRCFFYLQYFPQDEYSLKSTKLNIDADSIFKHFDIWLSYLKRYSLISFSEEELFIKKYQEEFYQEFEILDDDADVNPFEHNKQLFILKFLTQVESELKNSEQQEATKEIIQNVSNLRENIQNLTKRNAIKSLATIFAKIKKMSLKIFIDIVDVGKKELIKQALYGGYNEIHKML